MDQHERSPTGGNAVIQPAHSVEHLKQRCFDIVRDIGASPTQTNEALAKLETEFSAWQGDAGGGNTGSGGYSPV